MHRLVLAALALVFGGAPAAAQEALLGIYGAWVLENEDCGRIFASDNGRVVFAAQARGPLPAFIINSAGISNNEYLCNVREYRIKGPEVNFTGRCDLGRRTRNIRFSIRELNGQFQIEVDRAFVPIKRCAPGELKDVASVRAELERFERENATPLQKATGFWAGSAELCQRAFVRDEKGTYAIAPALGANDLALILTPRRFVTRGSTCTPQQQAGVQVQSGRDYQANYICSAEGREFQTTERIAILDPDTIERIPAARNPTPQRLVRCTPPDWEKAAAE